MKKLKVGTEVRLKMKYLQLAANEADEWWNYPQGIRPRQNDPIAAKYGLDLTVKDQLESYFLHRYSYGRNMPMDAVIVGDNSFTGTKFGESDFAYLVWIVNELGEDISYIEPKNLKKLNSE